MEYLPGIVLPVLFGIAFLTYYITEDLYNRKKIAKCIDFFIPIIGVPLKFKTIAFEQYYYEAAGHFQNREALIATLGFRNFRKKLSVDAAIKLQNYRLKSFQKGLGGTPFQYEGKNYMIGGRYFLYANDKLTSRINIENFDDRILELIRNEFQALCNLADKIDNGEIKYDFLVNN